MGSSLHSRQISSGRPGLGGDGLGGGRGGLGLMAGLMAGVVAGMMAGVGWCHGWYGGCSFFIVIILGLDFEKGCVKR